MDVTEPTQITHRGRIGFRYAASDEMTQSAWAFQTDISEFVAILAAKDCEQVERRTNGVRLSSAELAFAVDRYGRTIIVPPDGHESVLDVVPVVGAEPPVWSVNVALWTLEEGPSDLTLEVTVRASASGEYRIEIVDLHVL